MRVNCINTLGAMSKITVSEDCNRNCSPIKSQNINDVFVSSKGKNVSFCGASGTFWGGTIGMIAGWGLAIATGGAALPVAVAATAAGIGGAAGGAVIGDKLTGPDR